MNKVGLALLWCTSLFLTACSPIQLPVSNQYKLELFSRHKLAEKKSNNSILVSKPEAMAGYQTEQMLYVQKPFELNAFAHSAWISSPPNMLYPLIMQSLQRTGFFYAVASGPFVDKTDYRLDTQLIELQQNFLVKPSAMELVVKVVLTRVEDTRVVSSRTFTARVPCPADTPYGGVIAANNAMRAFTAQLSAFVVDEIRRDKEKMHHLVTSNSEK